jgi:hypothetical protein
VSEEGVRKRSGSIWDSFFQYDIEWKGKVVKK